MTAWRHRLGVLAWSAMIFAAAGLASAEPQHGLSSFGTLKYLQGFDHFDYANPDAPKGGRLSLIGSQGGANVNLHTFNTLNGFVLRGDAPFGLGFVFDSLMTRAYDEPDAVYGLLAHSAEVAEDRLSATFHLRPEALFADGTVVTAEDVVFSFDILKEHGHPAITGQIRDVTSARALDELTVIYEFTGETTRDLAIRVSLLPVFSKAFYATRDFADTTLERPLGSGPYEIGAFEEGRYIAYTRRNDYWAADLPVNRGRFNFNEVRYEYFRDRTTELEALKAGEFDLREEFTSRIWATGYDIEAVLEGRLLRDVLPDDRPSGAQGFFINTRRSRFRNWRVRRALDHAFDFEWTNTNLFHDLYRRTHSFFQNSDMMASGVPGDRELALLEPYRGQLPATVFDAPYTPPQSDGSGQDRSLLREAGRLLNEAGWEVVDGQRRNASGTPLEIEFLTVSESIERIISPYIQNLKRLGIAARVRRVDPAQYQTRIKTFDFDIVVRRYSLPPTPGAELRAFWSSDTAETQGSLNLSGISDPVVDALIDHVAGAASRDELLTAARALDRVLRAGNYWVPHWYKPSHFIAYWNRFSRPQFKPKYIRGIIDTWWFDAEKAAKLDYAE